MQPTTPDSRGEFNLIRRIRAELPDRFSPHHAPFGDDMAAVDPRDPSLVATTDMLMDGVDFESGRHSWYDVGWKVMAVNLSDCAAMAVRPLSALAASALNNKLSMDDALDILRGMRDCGAEHHCPIVGGDTNSWDAPTALSVTIIARAAPDLRPVLRSGARPGDGVYVSGKLGGSILGRHMTPQPRIDLACAVARELTPHAMIDISDGLAADLGHILDESGCGAVLNGGDLDNIIHDDAGRLSASDGKPPIEHALYDGEDFELIVVLPPDVERRRAETLGLTSIGVVSEDRRLLIDRDGMLTPVQRRGWEHFQ